jgi:hypothetical protein
MPPLPGRPAIEIGWFVLLVPLWSREEAASTHAAGEHGAVA